MQGRKTITRRSVLSSAWKWTLLALGVPRATKAQTEREPHIDQVLGKTILPDGESIVLLRGRHLERIISARMRQGGEAEIVVRSSAHLVVAVNPRAPNLRGSVALQLETNSQAIPILLSVDPCQFCTYDTCQVIPSDIQTGSRYSSGTRYTASGRYGAEERYRRYRSYGGAPYSRRGGAGSMLERVALLLPFTNPTTAYVGEHLL